MISLFNESNVDALNELSKSVIDRIISSLENLYSKEISELTEEESLSIAIMAGCELELVVSSKEEEYEFIIKTKNKVVIRKNQYDQFVVVES